MTVLTATPYPQCIFCKHLRTGRTCEAFPNGIPDEIWTDAFDHRREHPGDDGIRFEAISRPPARDEAPPPKSVKTKAAKPDASIPTADIILAEALDRHGLTAAYESDALDGLQALEVLHEVRLIAREWLRAEATKLLDVLAPPEEQKAFGDAARQAIGGFFKRASRFVREVFVAGALALGGPTPLDADDMAAIDANHAEQVEYLDGFRGALLDGSQAVDGTLVSRAEQYGSPVWGGSQQVIRMRFVRRKTIFDQERRVHVGPDLPCFTCDAERNKGWVETGTLRKIGDSPCKVACHCHFEWRNSEDPDVIYTAGRGPTNWGE